MLFKASVSPKAYQAGIKHWLQFCAQFQQRPSIASPKWMAAFVIHLHYAGYKGSTIRSYTQAVEFHANRTFNRSGISHPTVQRLVKGAARLTPSKSAAAVSAHAIRTTVQRHEAILQFTHFNYQAKLLILGVLTWSFLLRGIEILPKSPADFSPLKHLTRGDISFQYLSNEPVSMTIRFMPAKCQASSKSTTMSLQASFLQTCPVKLMHRLLVSEQTHALSPVFQTNGVPWSLRDLARSAKLFSGSSAHGFRSGGATALLLIGMPIKDIQLLGRWRSFVIAAYLRANASRAKRSLEAFCLRQGNYARAMQLC